METRKSLPVSIQVLYGIGVSYAIVDQIFNQWVLYFYLPPEGSGLPTGLLPAGLIALALMASRLVDTIADPLIGFWSDRVDSRWGRRIPFLFIGAIPLGLCTVAFFYPVTVSQNATFLSLMLVGCLFFIFYTIVGAPYNAMIPEISQTQADRLNLSTWQSVFRLIYTALAMILPGVMIAAIGQGDTARGIRGMAAVFAVLMVIGIMVTCFGIDERKLSGGKVSQLNLWHSLGSMFKNREFLVYLAGFLFFFVGFNVLRQSMNYYVVVIMGLGEASITLASALLFGLSAAFFYPVNLISKRVGYRKPMLASLAMLMVISVCFYGLGRVFPTSFGFLFFALMGIPVAGAAFIFPPAMLSEISAVAAHKSGEQIEGLFFGVQGFFLKMAAFIAIAILPVLLVSGQGLSLVDSLVKPPTGVGVTGIYRTTLVAAASFAISFFFYFLYHEEFLPPEADAAGNAGTAGKDGAAGNAGAAGVHSQSDQRDTREDS
ncbi:MFS transporter [Spirochaeta africana]|uniref:Na+/melibiose symporter-like transporter n=1 Tax=Spirochaeta africana (strain ATCC 700263 / DSM 8902 / Z-7692) TaxID=889378 RepID=H9UHM5_SPIAZ|nr:MFS transporter [Spirochaeta africana]AFG37018.1 Na+/melibiose symporter-like transporter [Spirochaeta africana DSM 8902]